MQATDTRSLYTSEAGYTRAEALYTETLEQLTLPYRIEWVETRFGLTHIIVAGPEDAPRLFLWHGLDSNGGSWIYQINDFAQDFRVYVADIPGSMGRSEAKRFERTGINYGKWMHDVLHGLSIGQADHVGISNGGLLIFRLAQVAPNMIHKAVLLSTAGVSNPRIQSLFKILPLMVFGFMKQRGEKFVKYLTAPNTDVEPFFINTFDTMIVDFRSESIPIGMKEHELGLLRTPTMILMGADDPLFNGNKVIEKAQAALPNLVIAEVVPQLGHLMIIEQPELVNQRIRAFLQA